MKKEMRLKSKLLFKVCHSSLQAKPWKTLQIDFQQFQVNSLAFKNTHFKKLI